MSQSGDGEEDEMQAIRAKLRERSLNFWLWAFDHQVSFQLFEK